MVDVPSALKEKRKFATPRNVYDRITGKICTPEELLNRLPEEVKAKIVPPNGDLKVGRLKRFLNNVQKCFDRGITPPQLIQMDEDCVSRQGKIDIKRLGKILRGEFDP